MQEINYEEYPLIPDYMMESIKNYVERGTAMGSFLTAVFSNDLFKAIARADDINLPILGDYVRFIHWELPQNCHGSREVVLEYMASKISDI